MKRFTIVLLSLAAALNAGGPRGPRPFEMPRYRLTAGTKLYYTTLSSVQPVRTAQRWQVWVVGLDPDSSFRLLVKRIQVRSQTDSAGKTTEEEWRTDWARCALYPGGRIPATASLDQADLRSLLPSLPADSAEAVSGWQRLDSAMNETETYDLDNKSQTDSLWLIDFARKTPLDEIYLLSASGRYTFDTRRGLLLSKETESTRGWGSSAGTTKRVTVLDSVVKSDPAAMARFAQQMDVWFTSDSTYSALLDKSGEEPKRLQVLLDSAQMVMDSGRARVTDTAVQTMFDDEVGSLEEVAAQLQQDAHWRDSVIGRPAPDWTLPDLAGKKHSLKDYRGRIVVLDFWYRGCPWCIRAMPSLNALAQEFGTKALAVIGMNTDKELADARFVVEKLGLGYLNLRSGDLYKKYGVSGFPTLFVLDGTGRIRDIHVGYSRDIGEKLARSVRNAIGED